MQQSRLVERGDVSDIFERPHEPYTRSLLAAVPKLGSMAGLDEPQRFELIDPDSLEAPAAAGSAGNGASAL